MIGGCFLGLLQRRIGQIAVPLVRIGGGWGDQGLGGDQSRGIDNTERVTRDVTRVGETIAYSRLRRDLDDFGRSRLLVLVLQQQLA